MYLQFKKNKKNKHIINNYIPIIYINISTKLKLKNKL